MMNEIWKDIDEYVGLYQVSNYGLVRSLDRTIEFIRNGKITRQKRKGKILNCNKIQDDGYCNVTLSKNSNTKIFPVHRLVAEAFIPNPDNLPCVNHKDENKFNNCTDNLEWCTVAYNNSYGTKIDRFKITYKNNNHDASGCNNNFYGKHHSDQAKKSIGEKNSKNLSGRKYIHKDGILKRVKPEQVEQYINIGFELGGLKKK